MRDINHDHEQQRKRLEALLDFATSPTVGHCNFGAMVYLSALGDVAFLAPIAPELRGIEIVSASPVRTDGKIYDIWKRTGNPSQFWKLLRADLTAADVVTWLQSQCQHTEAEYLQRGQQWLEDVFHFYQIERPGTGDQP
jgi:hypothetical protein